jgi:hypothetical protein
MLAFALAACGDKKDSAQRNLEAQKGDSRRDAKGKTDLRGSAKGRRKSREKDAGAGDKEVTIAVGLAHRARLRLDCKNYPVHERRRISE